jgi:dTDP-4-dehydrorhamnose reductase
VKTIVFGANGLVGSALMRYLSDAVGTFHNAKDNLVDNRCYEWLDITIEQKVDEFFALHKPNRIFIACANPFVDGCENPDTDKVNLVGISRLVSLARQYDSQVVFFSSSYVFDGASQVPYKPTDETFPVNRYGRQKEQIEKRMTSLEGLQYLVIRTVGVFGKEGSPKNFVDQVKRAVKANRKICVPSDQTMNPVWSNDLAKTTIHLADRYGGAIFHVSGNKCVSKYEWAVSIAYKLGCKKPHELIVGVKTEDMQQLANRPKNGCLDCNGLTAVALTVPSLDKGLEKYLMVEKPSKSR